VVHDLTLHVVENEVAILKYDKRFEIFRYYFAIINPSD
jgi:hypothetical protein